MPTKKTLLNIVKCLLEFSMGKYQMFPLSLVRMTELCWICSAFKWW